MNFWDSTVIGPPESIDQYLYWDKVKAETIKKIIMDFRRKVALDVVMPYLISVYALWLVINI